MSEAEDVYGRLWRKRRKLEALLTDDELKPDRMRWRTFERIYDRIDAVDEALDVVFFTRAARLLRVCTDL